MMANTCTFDPHGGRALCVASDSRLSMFDVSNAGNEPSYFSEKAHLLSRYSCVEWAPSNEEQSSTPYVALGNHSGSVVIWDVTRSEVVQKFSAAGSSTKTESAASTGGRIVDILWCLANEDGAVSHRLYTVAEGSGTINEWHWNGQSGAANAPRLSRSIPALKKGITRLSSTASEPVTIFAAGSDVAVVDLAAGKRVARLAGHTTPITSLSSSADGAVVVSAADERVLHLWDVEVQAVGTDDAGQPRPPTVVLAHPGRPIPNSVRVTKVKKGVYHVVAVGEDGAACVWRYKRSKDAAPSGSAAKPVGPACTVTLDTTAYDAAMSKRKAGLQAEKPAIIAAVIGKDSKSGAPVLIAAVGPLASPTFYEAAYTPEDDHSRPLPSLALAVNPPAGSAAARAAAAADDGDEDESMGDGAAGSSAAASKTAGSGTEHIGEARSSAGARASGLKDETAAAGSAAAGKKRKRQDDEDGAGESAASEFAGVGEEDVDGEWTLGRSVHAVIAALNNPGATDILAAAQGTSSTYAAPAKPSGAPQSVSEALLASGSLASVLSQALQAKDDAQLEMVLGTGDKAVIEATVTRLPTAQVLPFLARVVARFQAKPSRGQHLLQWLKALLTAHAGYLLGVPGLVPALEPLYTLVDARLGVLKKLLKLQGRLDLLLAQVGANGRPGARTAASAKTLQKAKLRVEQAQLEADAAMARNVDGDDDDEEDEEDGSEQEDDDEEDASAADDEDDEDGDDDQDGGDDDDEEEDDE